MHLFPLACLVIVGLAVQVWARHRLAVGLSKFSVPTPAASPLSLYPLLGGAGSRRLGGDLAYQQLSRNIRLDTSDWLLGATIGLLWVCWLIGRRLQSSGSGGGRWIGQRSGQLALSDRSLFR